MADEISVGELARQVRDVLLRFQTLAERLDNAYLSKEVFTLWQQLIDGKVAAVQSNIGDKADATEVATLKTDKVDKTLFDGVDTRVKNLEENQKWVVRLVLGLILVAIVSAVLVTSGWRGG